MASPSKKIFAPNKLGPPNGFLKAAFAPIQRSDKASLSEELP